jgi:hypothetical protein
LRLLPYRQRYAHYGTAGGVKSSWATPPEAILTAVLAMTGAELPDVARRARIGYTVATAIFRGKRRVTADEMRRLLLAMVEAGHG